MGKHSAIIRFQKSDACPERSRRVRSQMPALSETEGSALRVRLMFSVFCFLSSVFYITGCVERKLTINTQPQAALVTLNDEEIGLSPVTVSFEWYGDYNIAIRKEGYQTLKTHRELKAPWYDGFPFDLLAQFLNPERIVDSYEWTFELAPQEEPTREQLIQNAQELKEQLH